MTADVSQSIADHSVEIGDLLWSARAAKSKCLKCDGSAASRTTYALLFTAIGTAFGAGDGSTTFNVPDSQGRSLVGSGSGAGLTSRALGAKGGEEAHLLTVGEMPSHSHGVTDPTHTHGMTNGAAPYTNQSTQTWGGGSAGGITAASIAAAATGISIQNNGGGGTHNNMPPFLGANLFIYAGV